MLATRIIAAMVTLVLGTTVVVGWITYRNLESTILPMEYQRTEGRVQRLASGLEKYINNARDDVLLLKGSPALDAVLRAHTTGDADQNQHKNKAELKEKVSDLFEAMLKVKPVYLQARLIGPAKEGMEMVRVDRAGAGGSIRRVPAGELQNKHDRDYYQKTLLLDEDEVYASPVELNREHGKVEEPHNPVVRFATPVHDAHGKPFGILIINVAMRPALDPLRSTTDEHGRTYVVNQRGDYLLHPDASFEFGFDLGTPHLLQKDYPELAGVLKVFGSGIHHIQNQSGENISVAFAEAELPDKSHLLVMHAVPEDHLKASVTSVQRSALIALSITVLCALVLAVFMAKSLARPLHKLTDAIKGFAAGKPRSSAIQATGEIGILAKAFEDMREDVSQKTRDLEQEIEERIRAENQVRERQARLHAIVETAVDGIITIDETGLIQDFNPAAELIFGYRADEVLGKNVKVLMPSPYQEEHDGYLAHYLKTGEQKIIGSGREVEGRRKDGSTFPMDLGVSEVQHGTEVRLFTGIVRDISERKKAEQALRDAHDLLEVRVQERTRELAEVNVDLDKNANALKRSNEELGHFAYVASHDLQEPLRAVGGCVELLADKYKGQMGDEADELIGYAVDGADRMRNLIQDLLAFSRVGTQNKPYTQVDLNDVLKEVEASLAVSMQELEATCHYDKLPTVMGDRVQLVQLFQNLIANGIKFRGKDKPIVEISSKWTGDIYQFSIKDNGIGIDAKYFQRLFVIFQRLHTREEYSGTGIGLAICKKIVERHGGRIWVESVVGEGTTFLFTLSSTAKEAI